MTDDLESAIARVAQASRGVPPDAAQAARMTASVELMRAALDHIAGASLFDTEPAGLAATLEALADRAGNP